MERQLIAYLVHLYGADRIALTPDQIAEAVGWDFEEEENEAGELVITTFKIERGYPVLGTFTDMGKGT